MMFKGGSYYGEKRHLRTRKWIEDYIMLLEVLVSRKYTLENGQSSIDYLKFQGKVKGGMMALGKQSKYKMFEYEIFKNTLYGIVQVQNVYSFYLHNIGIYLPKGEVKTRGD